ncbi:hypothetical protein AHAS_Ahas10G0045600 [Arachis hypogaea]
MRNATKMASLDPEIAKTQEERKKKEQQLASLISLTFDTDLYGGSDKGSYLTSIPANEDGENIDAMDNEVARKVASYTAPKSLLKEMPGGDDSDAGLGFGKLQKITDREATLSVHQLEALDQWEQHAQCAYEHFEKDGNSSIIIEELALVYSNAPDGNESLALDMGSMGKILDVPTHGKQKVMIWKVDRRNGLR